MEKRSRPSNIKLIREAISLAWGPWKPDVLDETDKEVGKFYQEHKTILAGPLQSAIEKHYNIGNTSVFVPKRIQKLFMDADRVLADLAETRAEREDRLIRLAKERER